MYRLLTKVHRLTSKYRWKAGDQINHFKVISSNQQPDFNCYLHHLQHQTTKTQWYHLESEDTNNCFASIIKTLTDNNKGTPHILEHLACCGSDKYPIRDPFFNMLKRSLNTYMNAWTGDDFTCYPFSSANQKDFQNLLKVYLDIVFAAKLDYLDFRQQGWRYQINNGKVQYKGIVLNQMKGAYQAPERGLLTQLAKNLFGETPYAYDTGGQPAEIVKLSYEELKALHKRFYHPSNLKFYSYGSFDIKQNMQYIHEEYLKKYEKAGQSDPNIVPRLVKKQSVVYAKSEQNQIIFAYYLGNIQNIPRLEHDALTILSYLLFETNQADFYEELIQKKIGECFTDQYGYSASKLATFSFGVKSFDDSLTQDRFKKIIEDKLSEIKRTGFSEQRIKLAFHQARIGQLIPKKNNGLRLLESLLIPINHDCNLNQVLSYQQSLRQLETKINTQQYLAYIIDKYFLNNQHKTSVMQLEQQNPVDKVLQPPSDLDFQQIQKQQGLLKQRQQRKVDNNILPTLELEDIGQQTKTEIIVKQQSGYKNYLVATSKGLSHFKAVFKLTDQLLIEDLELWCYLLNKGISTSNIKYKLLAQQISLLGTNFNVTNEFHPFTGQCLVIFNITCLEENLEAAMKLIRQIILDPAFEEQNITTLLKSYQNDLKSDVAQNPMQYARSVAASLVSDIDYRRQKLRRNKHGAQLADSYLRGNRQPVDNLLRIHRYLRQSDISLIYHTGDQSVFNYSDIFLQGFQKNKIVPIQKNIFTPKYESRVYTNNYDVNCCVQSFAGPQTLTSDSSYLAVFLEILGQKYLHKEIREMGGAYGSGAKLVNGVILLSSYLDPRCQQTFEVFNNSVSNLLVNADITRDQLKQAKLSLFSRIDQPVIEYEKGLSEILYGASFEKIENYRETIKKAELKEIRETAQKYLKNKNYSRVNFGKDIPVGFVEERIDL